jgi:hypothetical protein
MKVDATTLLLLAAAAVGVYLITRPKPAPAPVYNPYPAGYSPYSAPVNTTAQDINAGSSAISNIIKSLGQSGLFDGGGSGGSAAVTDYSAV